MVALEPAPGGQPPHLHRRLLRRDLPGAGARPGRVRPAGHLPRPVGPRRGRRRRCARTRDGLDRDALEPAPPPDRHPGRGRRWRAPAARSPRWTTPSSRRRCSGPSSTGADLVVHSTTKYLNGHSDVVGGAVVAAPGAARAPAAHPEHEQHARHLPEPARRASWCCAGSRPCTCACGARGRRPGGGGLPGRAPGRWRRVHYPGLASHPQHALARRQQRGFGAMVSFELRRGTREPGRPRAADAALVHAGGEPGRGGEPGGPPGHR